MSHLFPHLRFILIACHIANGFDDNKQHLSNNGHDCQDTEFNRAIITEKAAVTKINDNTGLQHTVADQAALHIDGVRHLINIPFPVLHDFSRSRRLSFFYPVVPQTRCKNNQRQHNRNHNNLHLLCHIVHIPAHKRTSYQFCVRTVIPTANPISTHRTSALR